MSGYFFRTSYIILFLFAVTFKSSAQQLKFLIPDAAITQFAGSIGYVSVGAGYDLFKNKRGNLDFNYGYVPKSKGGELHSLTVKFAYRPFEVKIKDWAKFYPFNPGFFATYTFHKDLSFRFSTDDYPKGYYFWSEALRPHLSFSNEIEFDTKKILKGSKIKAISVYSEFNTNEYYLINYFQNMKELSISDIFLLGIGVRVKF